MCVCAHKQRNGSTNEVQTAPSPPRIVFKHSSSVDWFEVQWKYKLSMVQVGPCDFLLSETSPFQRAFLTIAIVSSFVTTQPLGENLQRTNLSPSPALS